MVTRRQSIQFFMKDGKVRLVHTMRNGQLIEQTIDCTPETAQWLKCHMQQIKHSYQSKTGAHTWIVASLTETEKHSSLGRELFQTFVEEVPRNRNVRKADKVLTNYNIENLVVKGINA